MKDNLFDFINPQMFTLFATEKYRRKNYIILSFVYDLYVEGKRRQTLSKPEIINALRDFAAKNPLYIDDDETGESSKSPNDFANFKVRQLIKCGWLEEEVDEKDRFSTVLLLSDGALTLMQAFRNIINQSERPISYSGYFYTVAALLREFDKKKAKSYLEQIRKTTDDLFTSLEGINSKIKRFIKELLENKNASPESVMSDFLYDYQNKVVVTALKNLMGKDNPSNYLDEINQQLRRLSTEEFDTIVHSYSQELDAKALGGEMPLLVAKREVRQILNYCIESYSNASEFIDEIAKRNSKYHRNTKDKIHFLMSTRKDIEGEINKAIIALKGLRDDAPLEDVIHLDYVSFLDDRSRFERITSNESKMRSHTEIPVITDEERKIGKNLFLQQNLFSRKKINEFVMECLNGKKSIKASEISINNYDDLYRLLLIRIYSQYRNASYTISDLNYLFLAFQHEIPDFTIQKKENAK